MIALAQTYFHLAQTYFQTGTYSIVDETVDIIPGKLWYYSFYANPPAANVQLRGTYQELKVMR